MDGWECYPNYESSGGFSWTMVFTGCLVFIISILLLIVIVLGSIFINNQQLVNPHSMASIAVPSGSNSIAPAIGDVDGNSPKSSFSSAKIDLPDLDDAQIFEYSVYDQAPKSENVRWNVKNFFAYVSEDVYFYEDGDVVGFKEPFFGSVKLMSAGKKGDTLDLLEHFAPQCFLSDQNMKFGYTHEGDGACNSSSMLREVAEKNGLKVWLDIPSIQQGHIIDKVQYPIPGVDKDYWTAVFCPGQSIYIKNIYDHPVWINWMVNGDNIKMWVSK